MNARFAHSKCALAMVLGALATNSAHAESFFFTGTSSDGHAVSGSASFVLNPGADTLAVTLANTTATTLDAGELFTAIDFSLGGLTPSLVSATGIQRTVNGVGAFTDTGSPQSLSWSVTSSGGGVFSLNFNPNAKDAILGPPTAGSYSGANGSIQSNNGHNPFAAEVASFVISVAGLEANTPVSVGVFRFGTGLDAAEGPIVHIPEPSTTALVALACVAHGGRRKRRTSIR